MKKIIVCGPCWGHVSGDFGEDDCHCNEYDQADPNVVGLPPFHKGCVCVVEETVETEFRAWDRKENRMFLVNEMVWLEGGLHITNGFSVSGFVKDRFVLMQYIGGEDKNGKRIFQYDVAQRGGYSAVVMRGITGWEPFEYCGGGEMDMKSSEIAGNVFENPELRSLVRA